MRTGRCSAQACSCAAPPSTPAAACARITAESGYPDAAAWADYFVRARATDAEALAAFGPRDGRG